MFSLFFLLNTVSAVCMWPSPAHLFPTELVKIEPHGLDDIGTSHYSVVFDHTKTMHGFEYRIDSVQPAALTYKASTDFRVKVSHAASLDWNDVITVTVVALSNCLNGYEIGHSRYILNITSYVQLFHKYEDNLSPTNETVWTTDGWRSRSHLTLYPLSTTKYVIGREYVTGPCPGAWIESELHILNSSHYTFWNPATRTSDSSTPFIGGPTHTPRCHREELGSVCIVHARTRLTWLEGCKHPVSIWQSVSQVARLTPHLKDSEYPANFDPARRAPVPDQHDLRYDVCTAVLCSSSEACTSVHSENTELAVDGDIFIRQHHTINNTWIEIQCEFEVVGFLDNIWSPHIYMRKWYGYEWY